jgi:hypothetical protein
MQRALESWIDRRHYRPPHVETLSVIIAFLAVHVEEATRKRWIDDPFTAQAIVAGLNKILATYGLDGAAQQPPELFAAPEFREARKLKWRTPKRLGGAMANMLSLLIISAGMPDRLAKLGLPRLGKPSDPEAAAIFESWGHDRTFRRLGSRNLESRTKRAIELLEVLKRELQT